MKVSNADSGPTAGCINKGVKETGHQDVRASAALITSDNSTDKKAVTQTDEAETATEAQFETDL